MLLANELYQQANQLLPLEKLRPAELLMADLDTPDPKIDAIWHDKAQKRWQSYQSGELKNGKLWFGYEQISMKIEFLEAAEIKSNEDLNVMMLNNKV